MNRLIAMTTLCTLLPVAAWADVANPPGPVIVGAHGANVTLLWQSNDAVDQLRARGLAGDALKNALTSEAATILVNRAARFSSAKNITVRVLYSQAGAVDKNYGTATVAGINNLEEVSASPAAAVANAAKWPAAIGRGEKVDALTIDVKNAAVFATR